MRGLAAAIMLQGHVFEGWLRAQDRSSEWFWLSQFLGGLPAPTFLFLVGVSLALILDRMRSRGASAIDLVQRVARRGLWFLFLAYAFRIEQFLVWYPASEWNGIFRVDTLNCIAACTLVIGFLSAAVATRRGNIAAMGALAALVVFTTPWIYPLRPSISPFLLSYLNGNGRSYYFSVFPWVAFALTGITFGYILIAARERKREAHFFDCVGVAGVWAYAAGVTLNLFPGFRYGFFDYSLTSPQFFFVRLGWILLIIYGAYKWTTWRQPRRRSLFVTFGQASLLIYWVHIEMVYGRPFHAFAQSLGLAQIAMNLVWIFPAMFVIAMARDVRWSSWCEQLLFKARGVGNRHFAGEIFTYIRGWFAVNRRPVPEQSDIGIGSGSDNRTRQVVLSD
jgi:uncharacterized membrane protein